MTNITEDYVSFETAKLLKEKGFDWDCKQVYDLVRPQSCADGKIYDNFPDKNPNAYDELVSAPTLQMAMKWLREEHHLFIGVEPRLSFTDYYWITANVYKVRKKNSLYHAEPVDDYSCVACCDGDSFEDACESAIKYCLKKVI